MLLIEGFINLPSRGVPKQSGGEGCSLSSDRNMNFITTLSPKLISPG